MKEVSIDDPKERARHAGQLVATELASNRTDHARMAREIASADQKASDSLSAIRALSLPGLSGHIIAGMYTIAFMLSVIAGELFVLLLR